MAAVGALLRAIFALAKAGSRPVHAPRGKTAAEGRCRRARMRSLASPSPGVTTCCPAGCIGCEGRPLPGFFAGWRPSLRCAGTRRVARGGLDTGRPAHVKCWHQATVSCGPRGIVDRNSVDQPLVGAAVPLSDADGAVLHLDHDRLLRLDPEGTRRG